MELSRLRRRGPTVAGSQNRPYNQYPSEQEENSIGSSRLQKAIERNRAKQMKRSGPSHLTQQTMEFRREERPGLQRSQNHSMNRPMRRSPFAEVDARASRQEMPQREMRRSAPPPPPTQNNVRSNSMFAARRPGPASRPLPKRPMNSTRPAPVSRPAASAPTQEPKSMPQWLKKTLLWSSWIFAFLLLTRLFFADRGVIDFYQKKEIISTKMAQLDSSVKEIQQLNDEIERINKDKKYQIKLAREHLGVISKDEYLILFAQDSVKLSN